jgi:hypothetical protein
MRKRRSIGDMSNRNLDGTFRNNNRPAKIPNRTLLARWLDSEVSKLRLLGFDSFAAIALHVTKVGRGEERALTAIPHELTFPVNYRVSPQGCAKALNRSLDREPKLATEKLRRLSLQRSEQFLLALQVGIQKGEPKAITAAVRVLEYQASVLGLRVPISQTIVPEPEKPKERAEPNGAIVNLFQAAMEILIQCGAVPRNYDSEIARKQKLIDVTPKASDRDDQGDSKDRKGIS